MKEQDNQNEHSQAASGAGQTETGARSESRGAAGAGETRPVPVDSEKEAPSGEPVDEGDGSTRPVPAGAGSQAQGARKIEMANSPQQKPETGPDQAAAPQGNPRRRWSLIVGLGLLALLLIGAGSAYAGYQSGIDLRTGAEATQRVAVVQEQYEIGLQDMAEGNYDRARQRFEYVIRIDPNYPGVTEKLAEVLLEINTTATPTVIPTPTLTPTPDTRGEQELYDQGQQHVANGEWDQAVETLLTLRKRNPDFHAVDIDGMLFLAFRNRGIDKVTKQADLEGGLYDLALAEQFGPLDSEAQGVRSWTSMYITGASFWEINWAEAVNYFSQVEPQMPFLTDGSGMSARERYWRALVGYGDQLVAAEEYCDAQEYYQLALEKGAGEDVQESLQRAEKNCRGVSDERDDDDDDGDSGDPGGEEPEPTQEITEEPPVVTEPPPPPAETTEPPPVVTEPPPPPEETEPPPAEGSEPTPES